MINKKRALKFVGGFMSILLVALIVLGVVGYLNQGNEENDISPEVNMAENQT